MSLEKMLKFTETLQRSLEGDISGWTSGRESGQGFCPRLDGFSDFGGDIVRYLGDLDPQSLGRRTPTISHTLHHWPEIRDFKERYTSPSERQQYGAAYLAVVERGREIAQGVVGEFLDGHRAEHEAYLKERESKRAYRIQYLPHMERFIEWDRNLIDPRWYVVHAICDSVRYETLGDACGESWDAETNRGMFKRFDQLSEPFNEEIEKRVRADLRYQLRVDRFGDVLRSMLDKVTEYQGDIRRQLER